MKIPSRTRRLWLASLLLLILAVGLWIISANFGEQPSAPSTPLPQMQPSPPWERFPTRALTPTSTPIPTTMAETNQSLRVMRIALDYEAFETAEAAWEKARRITPEDSPLRGHVLREGARLALLRGDLDTAEARAWDAVREAADEAETWALLGVILARQGEPKVAEQALRVAESLDPGLAPDVFAERWRAARQSNDSNALMALAQTFSSREPENPLGFYYRATALLASGEIESAFRHLLIQLRADPNSAAALWYALGEAYLAQHAYNEAKIAFDVAAARFTTGDYSLYLASDDPPRDLDIKRALALTGLNDPTACAQAEPLLRRWNAPDDAIERARLCQTPTPTPTSWIPVQIGTATPQY
ncbi:MAG TPA: hypothetical protein PLJ78_11850 [Anaerolineae bacterium]|nr:hypothetical protein [Anaerolineae bacterium]HQK14622.1 hypothetical protein [Anaerolineae bacterium]